ncbi:dihydropteroate synthase [cyanobacterium endosymbiont of Epithemia turgida]|uniref:dihydropteroate synthase n=1 Tax=cyanobacterium endosymbiont of Epithemia turgida TaxID=718217 RepID=UPI0005C612F2|nr:dihydropteroate synthase [cyanobacterium endosymbiont of Epithemia turgida]
MADLKLRQYSFCWGKRTYIMGILNVTPDSFSDGGQFNTLETALIQAKILINSGADIIDIGEQSTRPGSQQISFEEELNRVIPIIKLLRQETSIPISIDTTRASVADALVVSIEAGADLVNDVSGGTFDSQMFAVVAKLKVPIILMHIRGNPQTMQQLTDYTDLIEEVIQWLDNQLNLAMKAGIKRSHLIIDPGIGFAKTYSQNLELLQRLSEFKRLVQPIVVGVSRKRFIGHINPKQRLWGTAAACCGAIAQSADILRVHDVAQIVDIALVADAIWRS